MSNNRIIAADDHLLPTPDAENRPPPGKRYAIIKYWDFFLVHALCLGAIWSGVTWQSIVVCVALYWIRIFFVTAGYHRYFAHKTYKTSRFFQFLLAFFAQTSSQKGVLWWASHHRHHHKYSDEEEDLHSPTRKGFWYSHLGWIWDPPNHPTQYHLIPDFAKYPELRWLNKYWWVPPTALGFFCFFMWGAPGLFIGFFLSTVITWHGTFTINSLSHVFGSQRYDTGDTSRNNFLLAIITMGEGWHNNHHYYPASTRQGWRWWEIDFTFYILKMMSWVGLVWDLRPPPKHVVAGQKKARKPVAKPASTADAVSA